MSVASLAGRTWGIGRRQVLLLHGSTSSSATWWRVGPALADRGWSVTALDVPSHGSSPALGAALVPSVAAAAVRGAVGSSRFDLVVGHSFGAAVAAALLADQPLVARAAVLEELPGPRSVHWPGEARAVRPAAAQARADPAAELARTRTGQPRWADQDCQYAARDLAACQAPDVAAGLALGSTWSPPGQLAAVRARVLLLLAPDAGGINQLQDATALRGPDRAQTQAALRAQVHVLNTGHCIHQDDPTGWLDAVTSAAPPG